ncbi:MAG: VWA domain-containing protein [Deltaproteobacteria bacterium]|nr:VWA domain-containing protein [Deltaproteobacteria bacterium]
MSAGFDAESLSRRYAFVDQCPAGLLPWLLTMPTGSLADRVAGVLQWQQALLAGQLPPQETWPSAPIDQPVRLALESMNLAKFCKDQPALVESLLRDIVLAFSQQSAEFIAAVSAALRALEAIERDALRETEALRAARANENPREVALDAETQRLLNERATREVAARHYSADPGVVAGWQEPARYWAQISDVFGDLGELLGRGWDMSQGVLKHIGWTNLLRLRELIEKLPALREIVHALGRMQVNVNGESVAELIMTSVRRIEEELHEVRTPLVAAQTRGIERSGEISRMLPSESALFGHPKFRLLWHARRAECALMSYRVDGIAFDRRAVECDALVALERQTPRPVRGPIIAVIDTSGSMSGLPEQVAKAIVLEALRTAHAEKRACFVYAHSGPGQVIEMEISLSDDGLGKLLEFLGQTFAGGSDEAGVISRVVAKLKAEAWNRADVVIVSDGEWPVPDSLLRDVAKGQENLTRFHGIQIGNWAETGLHRICDPVHVFGDWAAAGGWYSAKHSGEARVSAGFGGWAEE